MLIFELIHFKFDTFKYLFKQNNSNDKFCYLITKIGYH